MKDLSRKPSLMIFNADIRVPQTQHQKTLFSVSELAQIERQIEHSSNRNTSSHSRATGRNTTSQQSTRLENTPQKVRHSSHDKGRIREALFGSERKISVNRPIRWVPSSVAPAKTPMESFDVNVMIPQGIGSGERIRVSDKGNPGKNGGKHGDLVVSVEVLPHPYLYREGSNIFMNVLFLFMRQCTEPHSLCQHLQKHHSVSKSHHA